MNVAITGASGFVGRHLTARLEAEGHSTRAISLRSAPQSRAIEGCDAVVNLAGENIAQRWTEAAKRRIRESRIRGTRALVAAMRADPPNMLISASACGYYGSRGDELLTEVSLPGEDFLSQVCIDWEREAQQASDVGVGVVILRFGMVLGTGGGALARMLTPFKLGVGGRIGTGRQWMSWIHIDDLCDLILFILRRSALVAGRGVLNATSPNPVTNAEFTRELARALNRPAALPVPALPLKLLFGEMAQVLLASQRAIPAVAMRAGAGFSFRYPEIGAALRDCLST
ncbi:MAG TPA: TIGR01777 family oxidoreductase [Bryobacteraceae bacterium]